MARPEVTPENHEELYDYYYDLAAKQWFARLGHGVFSAGMRVDISWAPGVEEQSAEWVEGGGSIVLLPNHVQTMDVFVPAVLLSQIEHFRQFIGNAAILTKSDLYEHEAMRIVLDWIGAIPVFRPKFTEHDSNLRDSCNARLIEVGAHRLDIGQALAGFSESTRNYKYPKTVQKINKGPIHMVRASQRAGQIMGLPIGLVYDSRLAKLGRGITAHIGQPVDLLSGSVDDARARQHEAMQGSVDQALLQCRS